MERLVGALGVYSPNLVEEKFSEVQIAVAGPGLTTPLSSTMKEPFGLLLKVSFLIHSIGAALNVAWGASPGDAPVVGCHRGPRSCIQPPVHGRMDSPVRLPPTEDPQMGARSTPDVECSTDER